MKDQAPKLLFIQIKKITNIETSVVDPKVIPCDKKNMSIRRQNRVLGKVSLALPN
jgi:hypothetical protein